MFPATTSWRKHGTEVILTRADRGTQKWLFHSSRPNIKSPMPLSAGEWRAMPLKRGLGGSGYHKAKNDHRKASRQWGSLRYRPWALGVLAMWGCVLGADTGSSGICAAPGWERRVEERRREPERARLEGRDREGAEQRMAKGGGGKLRCCGICNAQNKLGLEKWKLASRLLNGGCSVEEKQWVQGPEDPKLIHIYSKAPQWSFSTPLAPSCGYQRPLSYKTWCSLKKSRSQGRCSRRVRELMRCTAGEGGVTALIEDTRPMRHSEDAFLGQICLLHLRHWGSLFIKVKRHHRNNLWVDDDAFQEL